jgi:hypothetical protein
MGTQEYRANYRVAMQEANSQLAGIVREFEQLQLRKEILEEALGALDPFLSSTAPAMYQAPRHEQVRPEPNRYDFEMPAPVAAAPSIFNEPIKPAPFAPATEVIVDPIQSRINRALGLAVA